MKLTVDYLPHSVSALLTGENIRPEVLGRIVSICRNCDPDASIHGAKITLHWGNALVALPQIGALRQQFGFTMEPTSAAADRLRRHQTERASLRQGQEAASPLLTPEMLHQRLETRGWNFEERTLRDHQEEAVIAMSSLANGANFSVPGAGKTTVTLAIHLATQEPGTSLLVVCPKNAFSAWDEVLDDCLTAEAASERFVRLGPTEAEARRQLFSPALRFIINYERLANFSGLITEYVASRPVHVVLDESHKIKNSDAQRSQALLRMRPLPVRRDILSGTPLPNSAEDLISQLDFLWPGSPLGSRIAAGEPPREVLNGLYVRVTKGRLGLPPVTRSFVPVRMSEAQFALYGSLKDEAIRDLMSLRGSNVADLVRAKRSVIRLLQASTNPTALVEALLQETRSLDRDRVSALYHAVLEEGDSPKLLRAMEMVRNNHRAGRKSVVWTIFRSTMERLTEMGAEFSPVVINGDVPTEGPIAETREGRIRIFHDDESCALMIANPAACSEGISLHKVCHEAVYVDRSYNAAHYLQSIDRIHRLGLPEGTVTNVSILQAITPAGIASIDYAVASALLRKLRIMEQALQDDDLRQIALDEEENVNNQIFDQQRDLEDMNDLLDLLVRNPAAAEFGRDDMA